MYENNKKVCGNKVFFNVLHYIDIVIDKNIINSHN
jgi:hypothetical protein